MGVLRAKSTSARFAPSNPLITHRLDRFGPIDLVQIVQQPIRVRGDPQHPLSQRPAFAREVLTALGFAVDDFLVGQHRSQRLGHHQAGFSDWYASRWAS